MPCVHQKLTDKQRAWENVVSRNWARNESHIKTSKKDHKMAIINSLHMFKKVLENKGVRRQEP